MRPIVLLVALVVHLKSVSSQRLVPPKKYHAEDEDDLPALPDEEQQELDNNGTTGMSKKNSLLVSFKDLRSLSNQY